MAAVTVSDKPGAVATNQSPPNPGEYNESRPAGIQRCVSALTLVCWAGWGEEGGENAQEIRDLLITLCSVSLHLRPPSSPVSYSLEVYLCWWYRPLLCIMLQPPSDPPSLQTLLHSCVSIATALWRQQGVKAIKCCTWRPPA